MISPYFWKRNVTNLENPAPRPKIRRVMKTRTKATMEV
jgi:hypothetical protein